MTEYLTLNFLDTEKLPIGFFLIRNVRQGENPSKNIYLIEGSIVHQTRSIRVGFYYKEIARLF